MRAVLSLALLALFTDAKETGTPNLRFLETTPSAKPSSYPSTSLSPTSCAEQSTGRVLRTEGNIPLPQGAIEVTEFNGDTVGFKIFGSPWPASKLTWLGLEYNCDPCGFVCQIRTDLTGPYGDSFTGYCQNGFLNATLFVHDDTWNQASYAPSITPPAIDTCAPVDYSQPTNRIIRYDILIGCNLNCDNSAMPSAVPSALVVVTPAPAPSCPIQPSANVPTSVCEKDIKVVEKVGSTQITGMPIVILEQHGDTVTFMITKQWDSNGPVYVQYFDPVIRQYYCMQPCGNVTMKSHCMARTSIAIVELWVETGTVTDNAVISQCCFSDAVDYTAGVMKHYVEVTYELFCNSKCGTR